MTQSALQAPPDLLGRIATKMPSRLSLHRLVLSVSISVGLLLCMTVAIILLVNARLSIDRETASAFFTAHEAAVRRLSSGFDGHDTILPATDLSREIDAQRHISSRIVHTVGKPMLERAGDLIEERSDQQLPPGWFVRLMHPQTRTATLPVPHPNIPSSLQISTDPSNEIAEVWEDFRIIMPLLALTGLTMVVLTIMVNRMILRRLHLLQEAIGAIRQGDMTRCAPDDSLIEFAALAEGINDLAAHLQAERQENDLLQTRLLTLPEAERAEIASDLHDEMGPQLFALNAALAQAQAAAAKLTGPERAQLDEALQATVRHAHAVRDSARAAIDDLRPMLLGHGSLSELLGELITDFSEIAPGVTIQLDSEGDADLGELDELSIYRFVRESVLNAIRHGHAGRIAIILRCGGSQYRQIVTRVEDDGGGPQDTTPVCGHGLIGIHDRARALGATYLPPYRDGNITVTELRMPCR